MRYTISNSISWETLTALHSVFHRESEGNICVTNEKRELRGRFKPQLLSQLLTPDQSQCEVGVNVGGDGLLLRAQPSLCLQYKRLEKK